jgi:carboxypeptidase C (cathepsin A)
MTRVAGLCLCFVMISTAFPAGQAPPAPASSEAISGERLSTTTHAARIEGREVKYTATAGTLPLKDASGKVTAHMFFVAYVRDGEDRRTRPLTFFYNGGPGSASIWLHMGSLGPRRVHMGEEGFMPAPPFQLVDNEYSALDVTDLDDFSHRAGCDLVPV